MTDVFENRDWLGLFEEFVSHLRIPSKEVAADDAMSSTGGVPLELWGSQRLYMKEIAIGLGNGQRYFTCLKNRQAGVSTVSLAIDLFWLAMFPGLPGVLVTDTDANRMKFRYLLKAYVQSFPPKFFGSSFAIKKGFDNKEGMAFTNGSTLDLLVAGKRVNKTLGEGRGYALAHLTEVANYGSAEGIRSFIETLAEHHPHRLFMLESTAKGFNHWKEMCEEAMRDKFTKRFFFIGWWAKELNSISMKGPPPQPQLYKAYGLYPPTPDEKEKMALVLKKHGHAITQQQLAWYRWRAADTAGTEQDLHQNQPWTADEAFVLSGYSFFQTRLVQRFLARIMEVDYGDGGAKGMRFKGYRFYLGENFFASKMEQVQTIEQVELRIWEDPQPVGTYVIGCDPAFGRSDTRDRHAISVWRCFADCVVQVAEYASNAVDTRQAAWILAYLAGAYRNSVINIEVSGGPGYAVLAELKSVRQMLNSEMYATQVAALEWEDFLSNARFFIYRKYDNLSSSGNLTQWKTSRDNKFEIMNQLRDSMATNAITINSKLLLEEMLAVVQNEGSIEAPDPQKDDRVFACALANRTWKDMVQPSLIAANATYDRVMAGELDEELRIEGFANKLVENFFKRAEERAQNVDNVPRWMRERGLA